MIDYLFASLSPGKGDDLAETGLSSIVASIALVVGTIILRPAIERHIHPAIWGHTPTNLNNRQFFKSVLGRRDLLSPALDGLSTLHLVKPTKAVIATAVTVVKAVPTPVQILQEKSSFSPIFGIIACMILALAGTALSYQHYRQGVSWSSPSAASSDNGDSSLEPYSRDSSPPNDDSSDEESGSGGHPPPVPVFDLFYDFPTLHLDKAVDTGDELVRDEGSPPPPPPPSFPTPVEDGDASPRKPFISKWLSLTLVLSIISLVIKRFFKRSGKTQNEASTPVPTVSERITVNELSGDVATLFPSATLNPVIINTNPTCPNVLPLVEPLVEIETKPESLSVSTLVTSPVSQRSRKFMITVFSLLFMSCLFGLSFIARYFLDHHLRRITNTFLPMANRSLDEITASVPVTTSSATSLPLAPTFAPETHDTAGSNEVTVTTGGDEEIDGLLLSPTFEPETDDAAGSDELNAVTIKSSISSSSPKTSVEQELSFNNVGDNTLVIYGKASPLAVELEDIFDASDDGVPFLEVFRAMSISGSSSEVPVPKEEPITSTTPTSGLPNTREKCTVNGKDIKVLSEHVPKSNIPILAKKVQTVPVALARSHTLPISGAALVRNTTNRKSSFMEPLNSKAASFVPTSHIPMRTHSSSTSLRYRHSPPSPSRPDLSASIYAPFPEEDFCDSIYAPSTPPRPDSNANVYVPRSPPRPDSSANVYVPRSPPRHDLRASIHAPCTPPRRGLNASIHAPSQLEPMEPTLPIPVVDLSPDRRVRRVIDPERGCNLVVLVDGGSVSPVSP